MVTQEGWAVSFLCRLTDYQKKGAGVGGNHMRQGQEAGEGGKGRRQEAAGSVRRLRYEAGAGGRG